MEHERVDLGAEFGDDEIDLAGHQARNERDVSAQAIELGDDDRTAESLRSIERRCKLWPAIERLRALAGFDLGHFGRDLQPLGFGEPGDRRALCFEAVAGPQSCARMRAIALGP